jgi:deaminated glutathione amidase
VALKTALIQMRSGRDMARNLADVSELITEAAARGAQLVLTPEMTNILEPARDRLRALVRPENEDDTVRGLSALSRKLGIWLLAGSLALKGAASKLLNRSILFAPDGAAVARYDKIHLFDVDLPDGQRLRESEAYEGGHDVPVASTPWGGLGLTICYDLRFPQLYLALAQTGASFLTVPSAFTKVTGEAHWHVLLRARAIETGSYILAPAQGGRHESGRETYGHSLIVSPWGDILAEGGEDPGIVMTTIDAGEVLRARKRIPAIFHARSLSLKRPMEIAT